MGQLLQKVKLESHTRIVIALEVGYLVRCYTFRVSIKDSNFDVIDQLKVGDNVLFTGEVQDGETMDDIKLDSIIKKDFISCPTCGIAMVSDKCILKHDREAIKLQGTWAVVQTSGVGYYMKIWFEKDNLVFGAISCPQMWHYPDFMNLRRGDLVELEGWAYKDTNTLKYVRKCT